MAVLVELLIDASLPTMALAFSLLIRFHFVKISSGSAVDNFYWILVARLFRGQYKLPVSMDGKYLLEDDRLSYPFGFGLFLSKFSESFLRSSKSKYITQAADILVLAVLFLLGIIIGLDHIGLAVMTLVYGLAPVLVSYNTQLTSRSLGNLFLVCSLICQLLATTYDNGLNLLFGFFASVTLAAMFVTHKMTIQYYIFLFPGWVYSMITLDQSGFFIVVVSTLFALAFATIFTGLNYQKLQWQAHWEIISFWRRNWHLLGAHQFRDSPLYGCENKFSISRFHAPGIKGVLRHCTLLFAYLPLALFLPLTMLVNPAPAVWVFIPAVFALIFAALTLLVPPLKCLGGGHLYMFNAVPFVSIWWGVLISENHDSGLVLLLFAVGILLTLLCLFVGATSSINFS